MTKNPLVNALAAALYIVVAMVMFYGPRMAGRVDSIILPIAIISNHVVNNRRHPITAVPAIQDRSDGEPGMSRPDCRCACRWE